MLPDSTTLSDGHAWGREGKGGEKGRVYLGLYVSPVELPSRWAPWAQLGTVWYTLIFSSPCSCFPTINLLLFKVYQMPGVAPGLDSIELSGVHYLNWSQMGSQVSWSLLLTIENVFQDWPPEWHWQADFGVLSIHARYRIISGFWWPMGPSHAYEPHWSDLAYLCSDHRAASSLQNLKAMGAATFTLCPFLRMVVQIRVGAVSWEVGRFLVCFGRACTFVEGWKRVATKMTYRLGQEAEVIEYLANDRSGLEDKGLESWSWLWHCIREGNA